MNITIELTPAEVKTIVSALRVKAENLPQFSPTATALRKLRDAVLAEETEGQRVPNHVELDEKPDTEYPYIAINQKCGHEARFKTATDRAIALHIVAGCHEK